LATTAKSFFHSGAIDRRIISDGGGCVEPGVHLAHQRSLSWLQPRVAGRPKDLLDLEQLPAVDNGLAGPEDYQGRFW